MVLPFDMIKSYSCADKKVYQFISLFVFVVVVVVDFVFSINNPKGSEYHYLRAIIRESEPVLLSKPTFL